MTLYGPRFVLLVSLKLFRSYRDVKTALRRLQEAVRGVKTPALRLTAQIDNPIRIQAFIIVFVSVYDKY